MRLKKGIFGWNAPQSRGPPSPTPGSCGQTNNFCLGIFFLLRIPLYGKIIDQLQNLKFVQLSLQNCRVFVQKFSLTAYLWQFLDRGRIHKLKSYFRFLHVLEASGLKFCKNQRGSFFDVLCWYVVRTTQNYRYFLSVAPLRVRDGSKEKGQRVCEEEKGWHIEMLSI